MCASDFDPRVLEKKFGRDNVFLNLTGYTQLNAPFGIHKKAFAQGTFCSAGFSRRNLVDEFRQFFLQNVSEKFWLEIWFWAALELIMQIFVAFSANSPLPSKMVPRSYIEQSFEEPTTSNRKLLADVFPPNCQCTTLLSPVKHINKVSPSAASFWGQIQYLADPDNSYLCDVGCPIIEAKWMNLS